MVSKTGVRKGRPKPVLWKFLIYIADRRRLGVMAIENLRAFCEEHFRDRYSIEVIDLLRDPRRAALDSIVALPTVVRTSPLPERRFIGSFADTERVMATLRP